MRGWKHHFLSLARMEIISKAVVQAITSFAMSCFLFPNYFYKRLSDLIRNFRWGGNGEHCKINLKRWDIYTEPKFEGGLGFKDRKQFNITMLAKQGWRLLNNHNAYWVHFLKALYFPNLSFLEAKNGSNLSWVWSSLLTGKDVLKFCTLVTPKLIPYLIAIF